MRSALRYACLVMTLLACHCATAQNENRRAATGASTPGGHSDPIPTEARVDINHAGVAELLKVPGMTDSWAGRIIRFRPYRTKQDLLDKGIVTSEVYDRIKDFVIAHHDKQ
jgi:DNA uptake protein ComE-like DNA-binding protein